MVTIGFDKQCITPSLPIPLRGYAKERIAYEVHDDLYARCIAMEQLGIRYLFVQCDLIGVDDSVLNAVYEKISDLNIEKEHLTVLLFRQQTNLSILKLHLHPNPLPSSSWLFLGCLWFLPQLYLFLYLWPHLFVIL